MADLCSVLPDEFVEAFQGKPTERTTGDWLAKLGVVAAPTFGHGTLSGYRACSSADSGHRRKLSRRPGAQTGRVGSSPSAPPVTPSVVLSWRNRPVFNEESNYGSVVGVDRAWYSFQACSTVGFNRAISVSDTRVHSLM